MDYRELRSALNSKGNTTENRKGDHIFFTVEIAGHIYRATKISHSARGQISGDLLGLISRQMGLTTRELNEFVSCTISRADWIKLWQERKPF